MTWYQESYTFLLNIEKNHEQFVSNGKIALSQSVAQRAKKYQTEYKVGYNKIYDEGVIKAKKEFDKIVKNKSLGKIVLIRSHRLSGSGYDDKNFYIKSSEKNSLSTPFWSLKLNWLPQKFHKSYEKMLDMPPAYLWLLGYLCELPLIIF